MKLLNHRVLYSALFFILIIVLLMVSRPAMMFEANGSIKQFGIGEHKTIVSLGVSVVLLAIISFYVFAVIDLLFSRS